MAAIWATGELWLRVPETIRIDLTGALPPGVTAKDLSLWVLRQLGPDAGIYTALEFGGPGLASLSLESRMVIPNMMAEAGARTRIWSRTSPCSTGWRNGWRLVRQALTITTHPIPRRQPVSTGFHLLQTAVSTAGPSPHSSPPAHSIPTPTQLTRRAYTIDLAALEPLVARPHNPANVVPLSQVSGVHVDQAFLGTCTNGRWKTRPRPPRFCGTRPARRVAPGTRLLVIPAWGSQVLQDAMAAGYIQTFLRCGRDDRHAGLRAVHGQPHGRPGRERGHNPQRQP